MSIRLDHLSVDIAGRRIVTDIGLTADDGRFTSLLGPNGSGKSTILKTIYRVHRPASGRLLLDGADLLALSARDAARRIAVVAQETTSEFDFSVREMVMIGRTPYKRAFGADTEADHAAVEQAIERTGCGHLTSRSFNTLSGGEKQLVLVARTLAQGADHLVLDEPTNHLDVRHQVEILEVVAGLAVTVTSCGVRTTYDSAPKRAVSNDINTTEDMLALGLESHMSSDNLLPRHRPAVPA